MSLVIATYVPEGIVMASDSRRSVTIDRKTPEGEKFKVEMVNSDAVTKTFLLELQNVGISNFGQDKLAGLPIGSYIKTFVEEELTNVDDVVTIPKKLIKYFRKSFADANTGFHIAGYKKEGKANVPYIYYCHVARDTVERRNVEPDGSLFYGATWSGNIDVITSIISPVVIKDEQGKDKVIRPVPQIIWSAMTLHDAIDFCIYAIRTTIDTMRFQARPKTVGGPIDVLVLTPEVAKWIQRKELYGR